MTEKISNACAIPPRPAAPRRKAGRIVYWASLALTFFACIAVTSAIGSTTRVYHDTAMTSMETTLHAGDTLVVDVWRNVRRGDIVVFSRPHVQGGFVKRVIALPGDLVVCCDAYGHVAVDGRTLNETYVSRDSDLQPFIVKLPPGQMWVMGDNRADSIDSRKWGPVPMSGIVGRVFAVGHGAAFTMLHTPATFVADGLAPADTRTPPLLVFLPPGLAIFVIGVLLAAVGLIRTVRRLRGQRQHFLAVLSDSVPPG